MTRIGMIIIYYLITHVYSLLKINMSIDDHAACDHLPSLQLSYFTEALWKVVMKIICGATEATRSLNITVVVASDMPYNGRQVHVT